jgi:hypothetical protein
MKPNNTPVAVRYSCVLIPFIGRQQQPRWAIKKDGAYPVRGKGWFESAVGILQPTISEGRLFFLSCRRRNGGYGGVGFGSGEKWPSQQRMQNK